MEDRRLQLLAQISEDHRPTAALILGEVDVRLEEKAAEMRVDVAKKLEMVKDTCEDRFVEVIQILRDGETERALALKENTAISQAAVEASIANGHAIKALADALPMTIAAEQGMKKGGHFIVALFAILKSLGVWLGRLGEWVKRAFMGAMIIIFFWAMAQGKITWPEVKGMATKIMGG